MRDPSPYAGQTVQLRVDAPEVGGLQAEVLDWWANATIDHGAGKVKGEDYAIRRAIGNLPDDEEALYARVDGMMRIIHVTEIEGHAPPIAQVKAEAVEARDVGATCSACDQTIKSGDMVAVLILGPGRSPKSRAKARAKEPYEAAAIEVHWACATGDETYEQAED
jgi:hypothetical protein